MKPRIFISAVTKELRSARQLVANTLVALGYEPIWQDIFDTSGEDIRAMLRSKIDSCSAVLQIVGEAYGAEPRTPDEKFGRVSYTQYEALYARSIGKKVYYLIASNDLPRDAKPESIDLPRDDSDAARGDADQRRQLQRDYLVSIQSTGHIYYAVQSNPETELAVRRLKDELDQLRRGFRNWMIGVSIGLIGIALGIAWLVASGEKTKKDLTDVIETAVRELTNPSVLAEQIRKEIHATTEAKINALPDQPGRGQLIADLENERDLALGRVDDLIKLIQEGLREGATPVFQRAADILQKEGTDKALAYLDSRRQATLNDARRHADQAKASEAKAKAERELRNKSLQPLILEAELLESKLQWEAALKLREQVAELAPDWFEARNSLGVLYLKLARFQEAEPNLRAAIKLADTANKESIALSNLASLFHDTNRLAEAEPLMRKALTVDEQTWGPSHFRIAFDLNNLALLLKTTNRLFEAEPLMRRALAITEKTHGDEHPDVGNYLSNLAQLLQNTNRMAEAEPLMRHSLAIHEKFYGAEHPSVSIDLNNLAHLFMTTKRLADAEPLLCRALAITEKTYGAEHPSVATQLNNLAILLQDTERLSEAELMLRRALTIDEKFYGTDHPNVALNLNNLALLLQDTNRLTQAEPLMRRALAIDENSYGVEHPVVINDINNLLQYLQNTNRLEASQPLMFRIVTVFESATKSGVSLPHIQDNLEYYRFLLQRSKYSPPETQQLSDGGIKEPMILKPITLEVDKLLGRAVPVALVLLELDRQHKTEGKPDVYFLNEKEMISPQLDELLVATSENLIGFGNREFQRSKYADATIFYEEAIRLQEPSSGNTELNFSIRTKFASALRELGAVRQARDELQQILPESEGDSSERTAAKGFARYQLAICEWQLGDTMAAKGEAKASLREFGYNPFLSAPNRQSEQLLADLEQGKPPPALPPSDPQVELEAARSRYKARTALRSLSPRESASPLLDQMLGQAKSIKDVLEQLDQQYREQGKSAIWFLPLSEPVTPHLDQLLGPVNAPDRLSKTNP